MATGKRKRLDLPLPEGLSQPAKQALAKAGLTTLAAVAEAGEYAVLALHGMGPKGIRILQQALADAGMAMKAEPTKRSAAVHRPNAATPSAAKPKPIEIAAHTTAALPVVWRCYTNPADVMMWNSASDDWHCPEAENDLRVGGRFRYRMASRDGMAAFDFSGTFTAMEPNTRVAFQLDDGRDVWVKFVEEDGGVTIRETFDPEHMNPRALQRKGWQAILDRFARHCAQQAALGMASISP